MPQPVYLKKGDKISILSTARKISSAEIAMAIELAESWGLQVVVGKTINTQQLKNANENCLHSDAERSVKKS